MLNNKHAYITINKDCSCSVCPLAKQHRRSFPVHSCYSQQCFDLIHVDIWSRGRIPTIHGNKYFLSVVDDF